MAEWRVFAVFVVLYGVSIAVALRLDARARRRRFAYQLAELAKSINAVSVTIGQRLTPTMLRVASALRSLANEFDEGVNSE